MDCKERILKALDNGEPDRVPIFELGMNNISIIRLANLLSNPKKASEYTKYAGTEESYKTADLYRSVIEKLEIDATCSGVSMRREHIGKNLARDKYGTVYNLSEHGVPLPKEGPIKDASDIKGFDMASKLDYQDFTQLQYVIKKLGNTKAHFVGLPCPFKVSWHLRGGMQNLLIDYIENPGLVHDLARIATDFYIAAVDMALEIGADIFIVVGDLAAEHTTLISPKHFREFVKPYYKEIVDYVHQRGAKVVKHSDGNIWPILDDLVEIGFDGIHPVQPQSMDIQKVKEYLAGRGSILGNIDCRDLLPFGTEEEVENSVKETIEKAALGGGYIISSSNSIHPGVKPENYVAMVDAAHKYGRYNNKN